MECFVRVKIPSAIKRLFAGAIAGLVAVGLGSGAQASTTVYVDSSDPLYAGFANAVNSSAALGSPDGASAFVPLGGFIAFSRSFTTVNLDLEFTGVTGAGTVRLYVGQTDGAGGFTTLSSAFFTVTNGSNNLSSAVLSGFCGGLVGGCNTFVTQAWTGTTFGLDSVFAPNPEPSVWALMILSFAGVGWRMKALKTKAGAAATSPLFA